MKDQELLAKCRAAIADAIPGDAITVDVDPSVFGRADIDSVRRLLESDGWQVYYQTGLGMPYLRFFKN